MAYAHTDFSASRRFSNTTYMLLALGVVVLFLIIGMMSSFQSGNDTQPFTGFTMENVAKANIQLP